MNSKQKEIYSDDETSRSEDSSSTVQEDRLSSENSNNILNNQETASHRLDNNEIIPPSSSSSLSSPSTSDKDDMKRGTVRKLIEKYFHQLVTGCGNPKCLNNNCASGGNLQTLSPNQAAARALQLYTQQAELCELHQPKVARTKNPNQIETTTDQNSSIPSSSSHMTLKSDIGNNCSVNIDNKTTNDSSQAVCLKKKPISRTHLDEEIIMELLESCKENQSYSPLIRCLGDCFSSREKVANSFQRSPTAPIDIILEKAPTNLANLKKEDFRILEGDLDKDEDSSTVDEYTNNDNDGNHFNITGHQSIKNQNHIKIDLISLRRTMKLLYKTYSAAFESLNNAIHSLAVSLAVDLRLIHQKEQIDEIITVFVIIFEIICISSSEFLDFSLPQVCSAVSYLPIWAQAKLARIWADEQCKPTIKILLETLQQLISLQVIAASDHQNSYVQNNEPVVCATKTMKILYYANLLTGKIDNFDNTIVESMQTDEASGGGDIDGIFASTSGGAGGSGVGGGGGGGGSSSVYDEEYDFSYWESNSNSNFKSSIKKKPAEDELAKELNLNVLCCRKPFLPFEEFYNEPLSNAIEMDNDYLNYTMPSKFSFMHYSFILTPTTKTLALFYDNRIRMYTERRMTIFQLQFDGEPINVHLKLKVRREHIIDDALVELEVVAMQNPKDLKKQLVVEFIGEQGIDEGGVSKEFFQLIVEQIFNPDFGMFIEQEDTKFVWFNSTSFENDAQFTLIGIVIGLAIYNNIILAVNFPMVVYRKLMGSRGTFADLEDWNPILYRSLVSMLNHTENDMEDVFVQTFEISYKDVFDNEIKHILKPGGESIMVNQENKQEFVDLYSDFLLNSSVEKQFRAFRRGFLMVTDESPLNLLFRPEEVELLVCGSKQFDFDELEKSTEYDGGYTEKSQTIIDFWSIVHTFPMELKKKLLEFTTGSDRVPVGGLSKLKLVIARNGPDSDRLPTSHTCFNILLLPEYSDKEKLEQRLVKAINYSKGFGML